MTKTINFILIKLNSKASLNILSELAIKITMFIFMSKIAIEWNTSDYSSFVAINALLASFLPFGNLGIDSNYLIEKKFRSNNDFRKLLNLKVILSIITALLFFVYAYSNFDFFLVINFTFLLLFYGYNSEFVLLSQKKWYSVFKSNILFIVVLGSAIFIKSNEISLCLFVLSFVVKFIVQRANYELSFFLNFDFKDFKVIKYTIRFITAAFLVQLYMNIIKISLYDKGEFNLLKNYDLLLRFFLVFEVFIVLVVRQFSVYLTEIKKTQIVAFCVTVWLCILIAFFIAPHKFYIDYFNISINNQFTVLFFYLFISLSVSNQLIGLYLQSFGKVINTLYVSILLLFIVLIINYMNIKVDLHNISILIFTLKLIESLYLFYLFFLLKTVYFEKK